MSDKTNEAIVAEAMVDAGAPLMHSRVEEAVVAALEAANRLGGDPTDDQVERALDAFVGENFKANYPGSIPHWEPKMRAALAAAGVTPQAPRERTPETICICGSTRFRAEITEANRSLTMQGYMVLAPGVFGHDGDPLTDEDKIALDELHFAKIDASDRVHIVNPGGYIGESTRREIDYALSIGKPVTYRHDISSNSPATPPVFDVDKIAEVIFRAQVGSSLINAAQDEPEEIARAVVAHLRGESNE